MNGLLSTSKMIKMILLLVLFGLIGFIFMLFVTIKTKSTDIHKKQPFNDWVGKTVMLNRPTFIFKEDFTFNNEYPYSLWDSLHPDWTNTAIRRSVPKPDMIEIAVFSAGAMLKIEQAIQYTNGVSGSSTPMLFGILTDGKRRYKVGYQWGKQSMEKRLDGIDNSWQFHQAPWQIKQDSAFYALPTAVWW